MAVLRREAYFPPHYREAEVQAIMAALYGLRSIAVVGPAGMGKSNLVRFVAAHPQARQEYLHERAAQYAFVHVDCTSLLESTEPDLFGEVAAQLQRSGLAPAGAPFPAEPRAARRALQDRLLAVPAEQNLVLLLDNLDEVAQSLGRTSFNYLCSLRNARPLRNLAYLFVTRRPLGPLYELQELFDDPVVVGPLSAEDARAMLGREGERLGRAFAPAEVERLVACSGGHPGFLKNASELLAGGRLDVRLSEEEWVREMLRAEKVRLLGEELWADLTPAEQALLLRLEAQAPGESTPAAAWLLRCGILRGEGGPPRIFSPLFAAMVQAKGSAAGTVRISAVFPNRARVETAAGEQTVTLPPRLYALLLALTRRPGQVIPVDEIIAQVYGDEAAGVSDAALAQLVKRLRAALDPWIKKAAGLPDYTSVETVWSVGYRLNSEGNLG